MLGSGFIFNKKLNNYIGFGMFLLLACQFTLPAKKNSQEQEYPLSYQLTSVLIPSLHLLSLKRFHLNMEQQSGLNSFGFRSGGGNTVSTGGVIPQPSRESDKGKDNQRGNLASDNNTQSKKVLEDEGENGSSGVQKND